MTRDEYNAIPFEETKVEFHRDPAEGVTYVTMNWGGSSIDEHTNPDDGVKFVVSDGFLELVSRQTRRLGENEMILSDDEARALAAWSAETVRPRGCSGYGPKFDAAMKVAHGIRGLIGPSDDELLEIAKAHEGTETDG